MALLHVYSLLACYLFVYRSTSESEESDDQISWALKRQQIKSNLSQTQHNLHHKHTTTEEPPEIVTSESTHSAYECSVDIEPTREEVQTGQKKENEQSREEGEMSRGEENGGDMVHSMGSAVQKDERKAVESKFHNSLGMSPDLVLQSSNDSSGREHCGAVQQASSHCKTSEIQLGALSTVRQHSTESFTLSSSLSEGEISPTKPIRQVMAGRDSMANIGMGTEENKEASATKKSKRKRKGRGGKGGQKDGIQSMDSSPEVGRTELGTRDKKEEGKKKKGERKKEGGHKVDQVKKKGDSVKAKKQRIRFDSLTTSSDEERGIDSPRLSRVEEVVEPLPEREEVERKEESKERLRQRLEHKVLSKKPPALFVTPATEPLFHQVQ